MPLDWCRSAEALLNGEQCRQADGLNLEWMIGGVRCACLIAVLDQWLEMAFRLDYNSMNEDQAVRLRILS